MTTKFTYWDGYDDGGTFREFYTDDDDASGYGEEARVQRWYGNRCDFPLEPKASAWIPIAPGAPQTIADEIAECEECRRCFLRYQEQAVKIAEIDDVPVHILRSELDPHGGHRWFIRVENDPRPWPMDAVRVMTVVPYEDEDD